MEVEIIRFPLINTPLQRGDLWGADHQLFQQFHNGEESPKPLKRLRSAGIAATQLKLGVNEKLLSKLLLQVTSYGRGRKMADQSA